MAWSFKVLDVNRDGSTGAYLSLMVQVTNDSGKVQIQFEQSLAGITTKQQAIDAIKAKVATYKAAFVQAIEDVRGKTFDESGTQL